MFFISSLKVDAEGVTENPSEELWHSFDFNKTIFVDIEVLPCFWELGGVCDVIADGGGGAVSCFPAPPPVYVHLGCSSRELLKMVQVGGREEPCLTLSKGKGEQGNKPAGTRPLRCLWAVKVEYITSCKER